MKTNHNTRPPCQWLATALAAVLLGGALSASALTSTGGGVVLPVQSPEDPLGLPIVGPVLGKDTDPTSKNFDQTQLPGALTQVAGNMPGCGTSTGSSGIITLDPAKLTLATTVNLQAYFVSESSKYDNTLGFNTTGIGDAGGTAKIIFPDVSSQEDFNPDPAATYGTRTPSEPLLPGDFVNLGTFAAGTKLDFFLIANGANGGTSTYNSASAAANPDGINHVVAWTTSANSPYLFLAFETMLNGCGKDDCDAVIALNVGVKTIHALMATPEPSMYLTLGGFLGLAIWAKRRMDRKDLVVRA